MNVIIPFRIDGSSIGKRPVLPENENLDPLFGFPWKLSKIIFILARKIGDIFSQRIQQIFASTFNQTSGLSEKLVTFCLLSLKKPINVMIIVRHIGIGKNAIPAW